MPIAALYLLEAAAALLALAFYKKGDRPLSSFLTHPAGIVFLLAAAVLMTTLVVLVRWLRRQPPPRARRLAAPLLLNLVSVGIGFATAEIAIRLLSVKTPEGPVFANTLLLPRSWEALAARSRATLARAAQQGSFLVYDPQLGWTLGPNRHSRDYNRVRARATAARLEGRTATESVADTAAEIYFSSSEGLRSPRAGMSFSGGPRPRTRIALIGDSFTFGLEVRYEETWGQELERALGPGVEVLNFGVDGYGVDQAYLRYQRDVVPWHPDIVILGVINDDLRRTMCVYGFLCFPGFEMPFPKSRFVMAGDSLQRVNAPLPQPESLFVQRAITDLPFIAHDASFDRGEWDWRFYDHSYAIRLVLAKFHRWPTPGPTVTEDAERRVNGAIIQAFEQLARQNGSKPLVVFFPSLTAFLPESHSAPIAEQTLHAAKIPYLDMTDCVRQVPAAQRFVTLHYSAATNAAIARCLVPALSRRGR